MSSRCLRRIEAPLERLSDASAPRGAEALAAATGVNPLGARRWGFSHTTANDDVPSNGIADATTTFNSNFTESFRANGGESQHLILNGSGTTTATGATFRFHVAIHTVLDRNGNLKVDKLQFRCF